MSFKEKYINRYLFIVFGIMVVIFLFSHSSGEDSSKQSGIIVALLAYLPISIDIDGENMMLVSMIVRKSAHMTEYFILTLSIVRYLFSIEKNSPYLWSGLLAFFYACSDEFHQTFIPGRAGLFTDVLVDSVGIVAGLMGVYLLKKYFYQEER
ncbi:MAG: VanZ family protein [Fusobacteriaceae bacterium]